jgi:anti-sigma factor RsiW
MISDDDLLLYHYRDGLEPAERARIGAALAEHPELAQRLQRLVHRLDEAAAIPEVPVPMEVQQRWKAALNGAMRSEATRVVPLKAPRRAPFSNPRWLALAATVAVVAIGVTLWKAREPTHPPIAQNPPAAAGNGNDVTAYERGLAVHLVSTQRQLASLEQATPEERTRLVAAIVEQNRIYALAAEKAGEPQLARVLRAFTPVLESLTKDDAAASEESIAQLGFELRVMQGRLKAGADTTDKAPSMAL